MNNSTLAQAFVYHSTPVRTANIDGEPWFCLNDVCAILDYSNPREAIRKHCKDKGVTKRDTLTEGGTQELTFINEPNLYRLLTKSRKPEAEAFEEWLMEEVLPQIRKTGSYSTPLAIGNDPILATLGAAIELRQEQIRLEHRVNDVDNRLSQIEHERDTAKEAMLALPAPSVEVRDLSRREECIEAINTYVIATGISHQEAWAKVYGKFDLVMRCKLTTLAKNRKMSKMDFIEERGWIEDLYAVISKQINTAKAA